MSLKRPSNPTGVAKSVAKKSTGKKVAAAKSAPAKKAGAGRGTSGDKFKDDDSITEGELLEKVPGGMAAAFVKARLREKTLEVAGLSLPDNWKGDMPVVPDDISTTDHDELSNLLAQFVNAQSTAISYATAAHIEAGFYEDIKDYLYNVALGSAEGSNDTQRKASAGTDPAYVAAQALWRTAKSEYEEFSSLAAQLDKKWKTVSRVGGFVGDDAEGQSASLGTKSTRGKGAGSSKGSGAGGTAKKTLSRRK